LSRPRKLYLIACCFPPFGRGNAITNSCVANLLTEHYSVDVVCMEREDGGVIAYQEDASLVERIDCRLGIHRIRADSWYGINTLLYAIGLLPCYFLNWAWSVWKQREKIFIEKGVVFAVYPVFSDLILGYFVSRRFKMPLLVDFRDDFSGVMSSGWRSMWGPFYRFWEKLIVHSADAISVTTESLKKDMLDRYDIEEGRISVVYNIVPSSGELLKPKDSENVGKSRLNIIYAGAMSRIQKPEILLKAYAHLKREEAYWKERLSVDFYGPESPYFRLVIRKFFSHGCTFGGFLPQKEVARLVGEADIGFFSLSDDTYAYATPTKLFDYIEAGVPIVASLPPGASKDIIEKNKIGLVADCEDVIGLAKCLKKMAEDEQLREECQENMISLRLQLSAERQIEKWISILDSIKS
jgi:glycosyltransferase involved in cell wall biosynthesis